MDFGQGWLYSESGEYCELQRNVGSLEEGSC